ncbi:MAG: YkgJ family cysteine cluster protein [Phycisphaerae bacterium]|nr:YkgJ family cysteine cluster protein [Phycisphaerae bacterium]
MRYFKNAAIRGKEIKKKAKEPWHKNKEPWYKKKEVWYIDGLPYECTRCGQCCKGKGYIWVAYEEVLGMAEHLEVSPEAFIQQYTHRARGRRSLVQTPKGDCVFLSHDSTGQSQCKVYPVCPAQCWSWPFWPANLFDRHCWDDAAKECPGIGKGEMHDCAEIRRMRAASPTRRHRRVQRPGQR